MDYGASECVYVPAVEDCRIEGVLHGILRRTHQAHTLPPSSLVLTTQWLETWPEVLWNRSSPACVNIVPAIKSIYEWQGKIEEDNEVLLMIKTRSSKVPALAQYVRSNHPYEVAEVISLPIDQGNPPYLKWIGDIVPE
ncbi:Protein CutA-like protein [Larimichthys crocea]|uniref:Uncharacterized protein n=1 Tax=Larimichthys crocea TaxID=215358 RepID=A0ACD3RV80_LARCR|nr:Protein CutA-like protein [Larimichthys crocea]